MSKCKKVNPVNPVKFKSAVESFKTSSNKLVIAVEALKFLIDNVDDLSLKTDLGKIKSLINTSIDGFWQYLDEFKEAICSD